MINYTGFDPVSLGLTVKYSAGLNDVLCACPWHGGSDSLCVNLQTGAFICYSCGEKGGPGKLIKKTGGTASWTTFQRPDKSEEEYEWRKLLDGDLAYDNPYLVGRRVTNEQVEKHQIRTCKLGIAFPLINRMGSTVGALIRRREGKVRYVVLGEKPPIWPMTILDQVIPGSDVVVTEGVFGVLSAERAGLNSCAVLGARVKKDTALWLQGVRPRVVFDSDLAGWVGAVRLMQLVPETKVYIPGGEADEFNIIKWNHVMNGGIEWTGHQAAVALNASYACRISVDKFWSNLPDNKFKPRVWKS